MAAQRRASQQRASQQRAEEHLIRDFERIQQQMYAEWEALSIPQLVKLLERQVNFSRYWNATIIQDKGSRRRRKVNERVLGERKDT